MWKKLHDQKKASLASFIWVYHKKNEWTAQNWLFPFHLMLHKIGDAMFIQNHRFCLTFTLTSILRFMTLQPQCWACQIHQSSPCLLGQNWSTAMRTSHKRPLQMGLLGSIKECRCWWYFALYYAFCSIVCVYIYIFYIHKGIIYHFKPHPFVTRFLVFPMRSAAIVR